MVAATINSSGTNFDTEKVLEPGFFHQERKPVFNETQIKDLTKPRQGFLSLAKNYAGIIDSRESLIRLALEFFGGDLPWVAAAALRNKESMIEKIFECSLSLTSFLIAPSLAENFAKLAGKIYSPEISSKDILKLINLDRKDLRDKESFTKGVQRVLAEEPNDEIRISKLYREAGREKAAQRHESKAVELRDLFSNLNYDESLIKRIKKIKEFTIIAESSTEGIFWGGFGLILRWFRKNILGQNRFTGTKKYLDDKKAKRTGEADDLNFFQKLGGFSMMALAPVMNTILLKLSDNKDLLENNKFIQKVDDQYEMTHGLYPKLGLMFSYTSLPKWIGTFITAQGKDELIERVISFSVLISSWWQGHKLCNGMMSKAYDKHLSKKYNLEPGIMVDKHFQGKTFVEPARIHQVIERTEHDPELQKEAIDAHAKTLYGGISLHSLLIFVLSLGVNQFTKWRVENKIPK